VTLIASTVRYALVVDDNALILMHACDIMEEAGFRWYDAVTGDEAIALLTQRAESITLLFSDVEMPGPTNGFALAHHAAEHWPWIDIIIASGRISPFAGDMPAKASFIAKPYTTKEVHEHLRKVLPEGSKPDQLKALLKS
jgi:CheY-like chemotaxis protein